MDKFSTLYFIIFRQINQYILVNYYFLAPWRVLVLIQVGSSQPNEKKKIQSRAMRSCALIRLHNLPHFRLAFGFIIVFIPFAPLRYRLAREPTTLPARAKSLSRHKTPLYIKEKEPNLIIGLALGQHKSAI